MRTLSATCLAIAIAHKAGTLRLVEHTSSYGLGKCICIEDDKGLIEIALDRPEAEARIASVVRRLA